MPLSPQAVELFETLLKMSKNNLPPSNPWPLKAYKNLDFLNSDSAREIRVLCEMIEPGPRFEAAGVCETIVLFGSARLCSQSDAEKKYTEACERLEASNAPSPEALRAKTLAKAFLKAAPYYKAAVELSERLSRWSENLPSPHSKRYTICSGGGPGIMEAANRGADKAGAPSVGLGISLPFEQHVNPYIPEELRFEFHYFFIRKYWFVSMAKALIAFPGGFGTLDELFETLTLIQTGKTEGTPPIILYGKAFWERVINFEALVEWGTISPEDLDLFCLVDNVDEAFEAVTQRLLASD